MPASNECIDWATVRAQVSAGELAWLTSDPGTGTLPSNRVNQSSEVWAYLKTNTSNPFASNRVLNWSEFQTYRLLKVSNYAARFVNPSTSTIITARALTGDFTVECWARAQASSQFCFYSHTNTNQGWNFYWNGTQFDIELGTGSAVTILRPGGLTWNTNVWYHLALVRSGANFTYYVDGVSKLTYNGAYGAVSSATIPPRFGRALRVAQTFVSVGTQDFDDLRLWTVARTQTEIANNRSLHVNPSTSGLAFNFRLENNITNSAGSDTVTSGASPTSYVTDTPF